MPFGHVLQGSSRSETWYAVLDYSTNYCNMRNLLEEDMQLNLLLIAGIRDMQLVRVVLMIDIATQPPLMMGISCRPSTEDLLEDCSEVGGSNANCRWAGLKRYRIPSSRTSCPSDFSDSKNSEEKPSREVNKFSEGWDATLPPADGADKGIDCRKIEHASLSIA
ncbi:hypothetical protein DPMN_060073 [Dreissena polymorpha]|uniref:Uncharacterized protein n=1 Tax=Dreissena polymorpha TaxID=45954 RepID=A0A9D4HFJ1_DREPO|nr:hypothetical protein DPMN_060073 [Dreissena polymorpha]